MTDTKRANTYQVGGDHYSQAGNYQHWDLVESYNIGYLEALATKYLVRWDKKGIPVQDLQKALHTVDKLLEEIAMNERENRAVPIPDASTVGLFCSANKIPNPSVCRAIELLYRWQASDDVREARGLIAELLDEQPSQRLLREYDSGGRKVRTDGQEHPFGFDATEEGVSDDDKDKAASGADQKVWEAPGASGSEDRKDPEPSSGQDSSSSNSGTDGSV
jgi:hypothetical protein